MATNPDRRWVNVRPAQAKWAVALLKGAGWGVFEGLDADAVTPSSTWGAPAPGQGLNGLMEAVFLPGGVRSKSRAERREAQQAKREQKREQKRKERY